MVPGGRGPVWLHKALPQAPDTPRQAAVRGCSCSHLSTTAGGCRARLLPRSPWASGPWQLGQVWPGTGDTCWNLFCLLWNRPRRACRNSWPKLSEPVSPSAAEPPLLPEAGPALQRPPRVLCVCRCVWGPGLTPPSALSPLSLAVPFFLQTFQ